MQHQKLISQWLQQQPEKENFKAKTSNFKNVNDSNRRNINYSIKAYLCQHLPWNLKLESAHPATLLFSNLKIFGDNNTRTLQTATLINLRHRKHVMMFQFNFTFPKLCVGFRNNCNYGKYQHPIKPFNIYGKHYFQTNF